MFYIFLVAETTSLARRVISKAAKGIVNLCLKKILFSKRFLSLGKTQNLKTTLCETTYFISIFFPFLPNTENWYNVKKSDHI